MKSNYFNIIRFRIKLVIIAILGKNKFINYFLINLRYHMYH